MCYNTVMGTCEKHNEEKVTIGGRLKCRTCNKEYQHKWYLKNKKLQAIRTKSSNEKAANRNRAYIVTYFESHSCVDCGESDIVVLDFDHLKDKREDVCRIINSYSLKSLVEEIAKCEVVCANCHRRRTASRGNFWRTRL